MKIIKSTKELMETFELSDLDFKEKVAAGYSEELMEYVDDSFMIVDSDNTVYAVGNAHENGCIWFVTSRHMKDKPLGVQRTFYKTLKAFQEERFKELSKTPKFFNVVWTKNTPHIRLIQSFGGVFKQEPVTSLVGERFYPFIIENEYYEGD